MQLLSSALVVRKQPQLICRWAALAEFALRVVGCKPLDYNVVTSFFWDTNLETILKKKKELSFTEHLLKARHF